MSSPRFLGEYYSGQRSSWKFKFDLHNTAGNVAFALAREKSTSYSRSLDGNAKSYRDSRRESEKSLSLSFRRTARFKISTCPVNKLLSIGTKRELPKHRKMTFTSPPCSGSSSMTENYVISPPIFLVIHRKSIENVEQRVTNKVRSAHFEDILYTRVCGST